MSTTVKVQIQQRIDTASNWTTANPTLLAGEVGWESDTKKYKIGTGSTAWASLAYAPGSGGYTAGTGVSISASNVITASAIALSTIQTAANETAMLALTTQEGDVVVRSDQSKTYMRNSGTANSMADFTELSTPTDAVTSVNGNTGAITADQLAAAIESASDSNVFTDADHTKLNGISASANNYSISTDLLDEDNFSTNSATKPPSQQSVKAYVDTADALKANLSGATFTGDVVFTGDAANVTWDKSTDDLIFNDNAKAIFGTSSDGLEIFHDGNHSRIADTGTGKLYFTTSAALFGNAAANESLAEFTENGSCSLRYDNNIQIETTSTGVSIPANSDIRIANGTWSGEVAGKIQHNSNWLYIQGGTSGIKFRSSSGTNTLEADSSGNAAFTGSVSDSKGDLRSIPRNIQNSAYTLVASDAGKAIRLASGGITIPASVMDVSDAVTIINSSSSDQTITQGSGLTMYNSADGTTGNRTLAGRGMATIWFNNDANCYISGAGLS